ncbi:MAG: CHAD domain-containing protein, partial [Betaproteobacteria bacterium]
MNTTTPPAGSGAPPRLPLEIELKLSVPATALAQVRAHPGIRALRDGRARTSMLVSRYYDTPEFALRDAGVALRVRRVGSGRWIQTAKGLGGAAGGVHRRVEFEWPLNTPRPDRMVLASTPWKKAFAAAVPALRALFATRIRRTTQPLRFDDGTRATLCLDSGTVACAGRRAAISEVEIELVSGDARQLVALARSLAADLPVAVAQASKAERGYALCANGAQMGAGARRVTLAHDATAASMLAAVGADCVRQIGANVEALAAGGGADCVHQLRVGARRFRSLLNLPDGVDVLPSRVSLDAELRWLGSVAGAVRDCDVLAEQTLRPMAAHLAQLAHRRDLGRLKARVTRLHSARRATLSSAIVSPRTAHMLLDCAAMLADIAALPGDAARTSSALALAQSTLQRRHERLRKRGRHLRVLPAPERHRARIAAKKLRYAAEFFAPLYRGSRPGKYIDALARLQDSLGRLNDIVTAE